MSKGLTLHWRYLSSKPRLMFRRLILIRLKQRFEFHAGPSSKPHSTFPDAYVMEYTDDKGDFYLLMYDLLFRRWIRTKTEAGVFFYGTDDPDP